MASVVSFLTRFTSTQVDTPIKEDCNELVCEKVNCGICYHVVLEKNLLEHFETCLETHLEDYEKLQHYYGSHFEKYMLETLLYEKRKDNDILISKNKSILLKFPESALSADGITVNDSVKNAIGVNNYINLLLKIRNNELKLDPLISAMICTLLDRVDFLQTSYETLKDCAIQSNSKLSDLEELFRL
jgi:hypothetical protein